MGTLDKSNDFLQKAKHQELTKLRKDYKQLANDKNYTQEERKIFKNMARKMTGLIKANWQRDKDD